MLFFAKLRFFCLFLLAITLVVVTLLFISSPYSLKKIDVNSLVHARTGRKIECIQAVPAPRALRPTVRNLQMELLRHFATCLREERIVFWAVKSTLLGAVRHGELILWDDTISFAILHDDLRKFVRLRPRLERCGVASLRAYRHGYIYAMAGFAQFPLIDITLMKVSNHEVCVCTTDEAGDCTFEDNFLRRREVFTQDMVFPLQTSSLGSIEIMVPAKPERCLELLYGKEWSSVSNWSRQNIFCNMYTKGIFSRRLDFFANPPVISAF